ncbi:GrpB family protein [Paenibacillus sp. N1-5-1-14]|uniref:GrpB family protein n=1 Tax=Paenibacillus radicibacter TaxID=2972488 RepID=UPI002158BBBB|nr:GrpB family protein [Paenibacillus radicibacter]MCR8644415.1 GrpB family protein [Paenibacillus radicibacter]
MEEVIITTYDPIWAVDYEVERAKFVTALSDIIVGIEHIGSTSVPGLDAKPVIDMMIGVGDLDVVSLEHIQSLAALGYEYVEKAEFPERKFFRKGAWRAGTHHLHMYTYNSAHWQANLYFRDYLRANPQAVKAYSHLKRELKDLYPNDRVNYTAAKAPFIQRIINSV